MFKEELQRVVQSTDGGMAGLLMDLEGIPLETYLRDGTSVDVEAVGAEISVLVKSVQRASEMLDAGEANEMSFRSDKLITLVRVLNETYFVALTMSPDGNVGKGRFLLRVVAPTIVDGL